MGSRTRDLGTSSTASASSTTTTYYRIPDALSILTPLPVIPCCDRVILFGREPVTLLPRKNNAGRLIPTPLENHATIEYDTQ